jgi:predicted permease
MAMLNKLRLRLRALFFKFKMEEELNEEVRFHLEREMEENIARGMTPEEARFAALRSFGGVERVKEGSRDVRGIRLLEELWQDLRYGVRVLIKNPGFTLIAVLTLALGIGANTAIFSVVNGALLRALPYRDPAGLVMVWANRPQLQAQLGLEDFPVTAADFVDWRDQNQVFEQMAAMRPQSLNLTGSGEPEVLVGVRASASLFSLLGVRAVIGRAFLPDEDKAGAHRVVMLSHGLWQRRWAGSAEIIGQTIRLDNDAYTVIGVLPPGFNYPRKGEFPAYFESFGKFDLYLPIAFTPAELNNRDRGYLAVLARLRPSVSIARAQAEMDAIARRLTEQYPQTNTDKGVRLEPLHRQVVGKARKALLVLLGAVGCLLLLACANVANLSLSRAAGRASEIAIRAALGAGRGRIVRQMLTESLMIALAGGALGLWLAWWGVKLAPAISPDYLPRADDIRLDTSVAGFTFIVSLLTGIMFGLLPALQASRLDINETLKEGGRNAADGPRRHLRSFLVVGEVALAFVLLVSAGLLLKSFVRLVGVDPGLDPQRVLTMDILLPRAKYAGVERAAFFQRALERVRTLPGVEAAGAVSPLPLSGAHSSTAFSIEGRPPSPGQTIQAGRRWASPDYFKTLRIPLRTGRLFGESDGAEATPVVVINESLARQYFANENPLGKRLAFDSTWREIVGVAKDVKYSGLEDEAGPEFYLPMAQVPAVFMTLVVRASGDPAPMAPAVRAQIWAVDKDQPVSNIRTMEQLLANSVAPRRFNLLLLGAFALAGLTLAGIGLYGALSYTVAQRTREIGVRMALGAQTSDALRLVIGEGMKLALIGALLGLGGALALTRLMKTLLFEVSATDPLTFIVIAAVLIIVALLACYIPARRATKVDPIVALRYE